MEKKATRRRSKKPLSQLEQVRKILNDAAGDSKAKYQYYERFWNLPLEEFLKVEIFGIRMIASEQNMVDIGGEERPVPVPIVADYAGCGPLAQPTVEVKTSDNAKEVSCCCSTSACDEPVPGPLTRADRSGLIKGLRGEFPFNAPEGHYPSLPWGATGPKVTADQLEVIAKWINSACPSTEEEAAATAQLKADLKVGKERFMLARRSSNALTNETNNGLKQRKNLEFLTEDELCRWRYVHNEMIQLNAYPMDKRNWNYWGRLHGDECQHGWEQFLLWHRMFLYEFEQRCQDILPDVTIPYWDWPLPQYNCGKLRSEEARKTMYPPVVYQKMKVDAVPIAYVSSTIPTPYQCFLNEKGANYLIKKHRLPKEIRQFVGYSYNSGVEFFWGLEQVIGADRLKKIKPEIRKLLVDINPLWFPFRFPGMFYENGTTGAALGQSGMQNMFHHHYPTAFQTEMILNVDNWLAFAGGPDYDMSYGVVDMNPHNTGHIWVGGFNRNSTDDSLTNFKQYYDDSFWRAEVPMGSMLNNLTACYDPIFWPHHSNVDRIFHYWQERHPGQGPENPSATLSGLNYAARDAAGKVSTLGYTYVKSSHCFEGDKTLGLAKFVTVDAGVDQKVLNNHGTAMLCLRGVQQPQHSYLIRIFLNQPDANKDTPVEGNEHYAGYVSLFGHGACIGGPGHCDPPSRSRGAFDRRPVHHNTPRNFKVDITETIKALVKKGAKDVQVTLVVLAPNNEATPDYLRLDWVSLDFYD